MLKACIGFVFWGFVLLGVGTALGNDAPTGFALAEEPQADSSKIRVKTTIEFSGPGESTLLETKISLQGAEAEKFRKILQQFGIQTIEKNFDEYYEELYGTLEKKSSLEIKDDPKKNVFLIKVNYLIPEIWQEDADEQVYYFTLFPKYIFEAVNFYLEQDIWKEEQGHHEYDFNLYRADHSELTENSPLMPLSLDQPVDILEQITLINKAEKWPEIKGQIEFDNGEIALNYEKRSKENTLHLKYEFKTKKDLLFFNLVGEHRKLLEILDGLIFLKISGPPIDEEDIYKLLIGNDNFIVLSGLTICYAWIIYMLSRKKR